MLRVSIVNSSNSLKSYGTSDKHLNSVQRCRFKLCTVAFDKNKFTEQFIAHSSTVWPHKQATCTKKPAQRVQTLLACRIFFQTAHVTR